MSTVEKLEDGDLAGQLDTVTAGRELRLYDPRLRMFPVLFTIPRTAGWLAQWQEMLGDPEQTIARPRQIYTGLPRRDYLSMGRRA